MKKPLYMHSQDVGCCDARTRELYERERVGWFCTVVTQVWSWDDGDAIVVVTTVRLNERDPRCRVVIRNDDTIKVLAVEGLNNAMEAMGLDSRQYRACVKE